jgi:putative PEP-CTERM system histidine kinase
VLAAQIGSYLAEEQAARALAEAQRFERMSKRFSFVAHDLKNLISQLAPVLALAERHRDNPAFVTDALLTVGESVDKMRSLLLRLRHEEETLHEAVALEPLLDDLVRRYRAGCPGLSVQPCDGTVSVIAERSALSAVLDNLVGNAREATGEAGEITIRVCALEGRGRIEIADNGPGMSREFVRDHLFQPFVSSKPTGFGIGMYQCREWVERWGGRLEVESEPGRGTTVRIDLPLGDPVPAGDGTGDPDRRGVPRAA